MITNKEIYNNFKNNIIIELNYIEKKVIESYSYRTKLKEEFKSYQWFIESETNNKFIELNEIVNTTYKITLKNNNEFNNILKNEINNIILKYQEDLEEHKSLILRRVDLKNLKKINYKNYVTILGLFNESLVANIIEGYKFTPISYYGTFKVVNVKLSRLMLDKISSFRNLRELRKSNITPKMYLGMDENGIRQYSEGEEWKVYNTKEINSFFRFTKNIKLILKPKIAIYYKHVDWIPNVKSIIRLGNFIKQDENNHIRYDL